MPGKTWDVGNLFLVPLADGTWTCGQVVSHEAKMLNSISCAFYRSRWTSPEPPLLAAPPDNDSLIAVLFTTKELLTRRVWRVVGRYPVIVPTTLFPYEENRASGWVGARLIGAGIVQHFLNAFFGLEPWQQMKDPAYFDSLLLRPDLRPVPS